MKVVLMAGGKGTRISSILKDVPKPMIDICGKPLLERQIESLKKQGLTDIIITVSHLADVIINYFGDGKSFGVNISYYVEKEPLGNAGALFKIKDVLSQDFLLINSDILFDINFTKFIDFHYKKGGLATLYTHPNSHPYDSGLIFCNDDFSVSEWLKKDENRPQWYKNRVNAGIHIINKKLLNREILSDKVDLDSDLLKPLAGTGKMFAYDSCEFVKDIGTPERYYSVLEQYKKGYVEERNLKYKQKAIFLDRDGTINKYVGFLTDISQFKLIDGVTSAIKRINNSKYLCIIVTNQPVIARGEVTFNELKEIHNKMETLLGNEGAFVDGIYFCPHHPDKGFPGEISDLKFECDCRKPKPGMLLKASKDFNIDLSQSFMIGDEDTDYFAGVNAGCKSYKISQSASLNDIVNMIMEEKNYDQK